MKIEILGSGGATLTPRLFSDSRVSQQAREKGLPYSRMGPAYFVHDAQLLIDTPEEINLMLSRSNIERVEAAIYSHWHPDHTSGLRVWEANNSFWDWPMKPNCTDIYLPAQVAKDFKRFLGLEARMAFLEDFLKVIHQIEVAEGDTFTVGTITIKPILLTVGYVYGFLLTDGQSNVLIVPDETFGWEPPDDLPPLDLVIMPCGLMEFDPFTGERVIPAEHLVLETEATFRQTLDMIRKLDTKQVILSHIEEPNGLDYDDYIRLEEKLAAEQPELGDVSFAYDMQIITVGE